VFTGPRDIDVVQALVLDEADDLVAPALGLDELRVLLVVLEQLILEGRQPEEIRLLGTANEGSLVVGTGAVVLLGLLFRLELLAAVAVPALVVLLVDVAVVEHCLDELATALVMARVRSLDEAIEGDIERAPNLLELPSHVV